MRKYQYGDPVMPGILFAKWLSGPKKGWAERAMHSSSNPYFAMIGAIANPFNSVGYTGSYKYNHYTSEDGVNNGNRSPNQKDNIVEGRDHVRNFLYGDDKGFEKSYAPEIIVNGESYGSKQYKGRMFPMDTLYLPTKMKPVVQQFINEKKIINLDENQPVTNKDKYSAYDGITMDNVASFNGRFVGNDKNHYLSFFDRIDFEPIQFGINWGAIMGLPAGLATKAGSPTDKYPNAGAFVLRQDSIPIKYTDAQRNDDYLLDKLNIETGNDNTKEFKQAITK